MAMCNDMLLLQEMAQQAGPLLYIMLAHEAYAVFPKSKYCYTESTQLLLSLLLLLLLLLSCLVCTHSPLIWLKHAPTF